MSETTEYKKYAGFIAIKINSLRTKSDMSQQELANIAGVSASAISQLEKGGRIPSLLIAHKIAIALNISVESLISVNAIPRLDSPELKFFRKYQQLNQLKKKDRKLLLVLIDRLRIRQKVNEGQK